MSSPHSSLSSPRSLLSSSRRRGSTCIIACHPGPVFKKSFPRCVSSLESRITSFDCSLGKHTSRSKKKRWLWHTSVFSGKNIYYRSEQLQQEETLVTVSPCEFPPRCHPRLGRGSPCPSHCHPGLVPGPHEPPFFPRISHFLHLIFPKFLYRLQTNNLLKRIGHEKAFP